MKRVQFVATSIASPLKTLGFPVGINVRRVKSDFSEHQMSSRIFNALFGVALMAVLTVAGSPAYAQSSLTGENAAEMARLLAVPAEKVFVLALR
jgi:hypothetical protein